MMPLLQLGDFLCFRQLPIGLSSDFVLISRIPAFQVQEPVVDCRRMLLFVTLHLLLLQGDQTPSIPWSGSGWV